MTNHINSGMSKMFESLLITLALGREPRRPGFDDTNMTLTTIFIQASASFFAIITF